MDNSKLKAFFDMKAAHWDERKTRPVEVYDQFAKDHFYIKPNDKVLDLGCGSGTFIPSILKLNNGPVVGLDISSEMINLAKPKFIGNPNVTLVNNDLYDTDLKGFDVIVCHNVYSHILDKEGFKNKVKTMLNDKGILAITHFTGLEHINNHHCHASPDVARVVNPVEEEVKLYLDDFDLIESSNEDCYIMVFRKK